MPGEWKHLEVQNFHDTLSNWTTLEKKHMEPENQKNKKVYFVVGKPIIFKFHVSTLGMLSGVGFYRFLLKETAISISVSPWFLFGSLVLIHKTVFCILIFTENCSTSSFSWTVGPCLGSEAKLLQVNQRMRIKCSWWRLVMFHVA